MNLTEFLKHNKANSPKSFGSFVRQRREEYGYSLRAFASKLSISAVYLCDIENGARPAPANRTKLFVRELGVSPKEYEDFLDLVYLSRKEWPIITEYITKHPEIRKALISKIKAEALTEEDTEFDEKA